MIGLLAIIGLGVILYFVSKGLKGLGNFLTSMSYTVFDIVEMHKRYPHNKIHNTQPSIMAENHLQNKRGENDAYTNQVREEIEEIIQSLDE